ncbi:oxaloacetate decarboxylase [Lentisphaerota bacterium ZTH]|nr:oxaloacetate decarboxylase [Lentisphaerota bacterium]WET06505.1 oxaloacetate decarboxylase [Lentisphaerota bacterium ZTH]
MNKQKRFRELVYADEALLLPLCHDCLSAKVLEEAGFEAICAAGYGVTGSLIGAPDIGLLSGLELVNQYKNIINSVSIPVFVDIDTGYGDVNNVIRIVRECETIGAAGLFIEDQTWPKRCGHMTGKSVIPVEEYLPKLKAAIFARTCQDFVIMARTDAAAVYGIDEAVRRAEIYCENGADMVFVEAVHSIEDMKKVNTVLNRLNVPSFANMVEGGQTPIMSLKELKELGYSVVGYPCSSVFTVIKALRELACHLKEYGSTSGFEKNMIDFQEYYNFIGAQSIRAREKKFYDN